MSSLKLFTPKIKLSCLVHLFFLFPAILIMSLQCGLLEGECNELFTRRPSFEVFVFIFAMLVSSFFNMLLITVLIWVVKKYSAKVLLLGKYY